MCMLETCPGKCVREGNCHDYDQKFLFLLILMKTIVKVNKNDVQDPSADLQVVQTAAKKSPTGTSLLVFVVQYYTLNAK